MHARTYVICAALLQHLSNIRLTADDDIITFELHHVASQTSLDLTESGEMQAKVDAIEYAVEGIDSSRPNVCWNSAVKFLKHAKNTQFSKAFCSRIVSKKVCTALVRMARSGVAILQLVAASALEDLSHARHPFLVHINADLLRAALHLLDPELRQSQNTKEQKHIVKALTILKTTKTFTSLSLQMDTSHAAFVSEAIAEFALSMVACVCKHKIPEQGNISRQQLQDCVQRIQSMQSWVDVQHLDCLVRRLQAELNHGDNDRSHSRIMQCLSILEEGTFPCVPGDISSTFFDMSQNLLCIQLLFESCKPGYLLLINGVGASLSTDDSRSMEVFTAASKVLMNVTNKCDYACSEIAKLASASGVNIYRITAN